jgi:hypothetical protein
MKTVLLSFTPPANQEVRTTIEDWIPRDPGILILIGSLLVVTLCIFIWAAFFRKTPPRPHYHFRRHRHDWSKPSPGEKGKARWFLFGKRHHHHHKERRRNATLAEAGGLPPVRSEEPPPSST